MEKTLIEKLKEYFENTTPSQRERDWIETEQWDGIGPTVGEFLNIMDKTSLSNKAEEQKEYLNTPMNNVKDLEVIYITPDVYDSLARKLKPMLRGCTFLKETIQLESVQLTLDLTVIQYHNNNDELIDIVPVWWECTINKNNEIYQTNFHFSELKKILLKK